MIDFDDAPLLRTYPLTTKVFEVSHPGGVAGPYSWQGICKLVGYDSKVINGLYKEGSYSEGNPLNRVTVRAAFVTSTDQAGKIGKETNYQAVERFPVFPV